MNEFVYAYRGNNTYVIQEKTTLGWKHTKYADHFPTIVKLNVFLFVVSDGMHVLGESHAI